MTCRHCGEPLKRDGVMLVHVRTVTVWCDPGPFEARAERGEGSPNHARGAMFLLRRTLDGWRTCTAEAWT